MALPPKTEIALRACAWFLAFLLWTTAAASNNYTYSDIIKIEPFATAPVRFGITIGIFIHLWTSVLLALKFMNKPIESSSGKAVVLAVDAVWLFFLFAGSIAMSADDDPENWCDTDISGSECDTWLFSVVMAWFLLILYMVQVYISYLVWRGQMGDDSSTGTVTLDSGSDGLKNSAGTGEYQQNYQDI